MLNPKSINITASLVVFTSLLVSACTSKVETSGVPSPAPQVSQEVKTQAPLNQITIVFGTRKDTKDLQNNANLVASVLSKEIGVPVIATIGDETAAVEALRANRAQVAFVAGRAALKAEQLANAKMYLAEVRPNYSNGSTYRSVFVVPKDSPLEGKSTSQETLQQLKGKRMAFTSRTSGSGFIFPVAELVNLGFVSSPDRLEDFFTEVTYGDGYSSALQAVLRGQADVAAVSEYALLPPWITEEEGKNLRVLQDIPKVPAHGIIIDDAVPEAQREKLINAFLKFNDSGINQQFRSLYNSTQLVKVEHDQHLATLRQALKMAKVEP
jgi:phosphonate transport system substrate-binding protein